MTLKIDKGIPMPKKNGQGRPSPYIETLETMEVGDSVVFQEKGRCLSFMNCARNNHYKVTSRKVREENLLVYRVWLTSKPFKLEDTQHENVEIKIVSKTED